jgi:hypothetical protein
VIGATISDIPLPLLLLGLEFPAITGMIDCIYRPEDHFAGGAEDRRSWLGWLAVAIITVPILLGYGIVIGYYYSVVRRNAPGSPR